MAIGYTKGCHKCGGFPGHKTKNRAFLVECMDDGTITCNQHLTVMGKCPTDGSNRLRKIMTQRDAKKYNKGGKVDNKVGAGKAKTHKANPNELAYGESSGGSFGGGGSMLAGKQHAGPTLNKPTKPSNVQQERLAKEHLNKLISPGDNNSPSHMSTPEISVNHSHSFDQITEKSSEDNYVSKQISDESEKSDVISASQTYETPLKESDSEKPFEAQRSTDVNVLIRDSSSRDDSSQSKPAEIDKSDASDGDVEGEEAGDKTPLKLETSDKPEEAKYDTDLDALIDDTSSKSQSAQLKSPEMDSNLDDFFNDENNTQISAIKTDQTSGDITDQIDAQETPENEGDILDDQEAAAIETEFQEIAQSKDAFIHQLKDIKYMVAFGELEREKITPTLHLADAFWKLDNNGAEGLEEAQKYDKDIEKIHKDAEESHENPDIKMSILFYEPSPNEVKIHSKILKKIGQLPGIYYGIGFGPKLADNLSPEEASLNLKSYFKEDSQPIAIGLIGLDKHYAPYKINTQIALFKKQFETAIEANLPVYITSYGSEEELKLVLQEILPDEGHPMILTDLIQSEEMFNIVNEFDMHICLRPELTHESHANSLEFTKKINPARWLLCGGYNHSAPKGHETTWNKPEYLSETSKLISDLLEKTEENFKTLCIGNMARLFFGEPWIAEKDVKEDIWADFR